MTSNHTASSTVCAPLARLLAATALGLLSAACGTGGGNPATVTSTAAPTGVHGLLPAPTAVLKVSAAAEEEDRFRLGAQFEPDGPLSRVTAAGTAARLDPQYEPAQGGPAADLAYCTFVLGVPPGTADAALSWRWSLPPANKGWAWLGVGNLAQDAWEWWQGDASDEAPLAGWDDHLDAGDQLVVALVLTGTTPAYLDWIRAGGNLAPAAQLSADPASGELPLQVTFDATGSTDPDGAIVDYAWDFDGDGLFGEAEGGEDTAQGDPAPQHTYDASGLWQPAVRVTDDAGATDTEAIAIAPGGPAATWIHFHNVAWEGSAVDIQDSWHEMVVDDEGGIYLAGDGNGYGADHLELDAIIVKYADDGTHQWTRRWGVEEAGETAHAVTVDNAGGVYVVGDIATLDTADLFLLKYAADGVLQWQKTWGGQRDAHARGVVLDSQGQVYVSGTAGPLDDEEGGVLLLQYGADSTFNWARTWTAPAEAVGEWDECLAVDSADDVLLATTLNGPTGHAHADVILLKYNAAGTLLWEAGWDSAIYDIPRGMLVTEDDRIFIAGRHMHSGYSADVLLMRWTTAGELLWARRWGGELTERAYEICLGPEGNLLLTGWYRDEYNEAFVIKLDQEGEFLGGFIWDPGKGNALGVSALGEPIMATAFRGNYVGPRPVSGETGWPEGSTYDPGGTSSVATGDSADVDLRAGTPFVELDQLSMLFEQTTLIKFLPL